jgi:cell wall-associated NlpC family hydrolase
MTTSEQLVRVARGFLGVRFAHQGRSDAGLDCLGLLLLTARHAGVTLNGFCPSTLDARDYGTRPDSAYLQAMLMQHLVVVKPADMQVADILLLHIGGRPQHLAMVSDYPQLGAFGMIHAYALARKVIEHRLDEAWQCEIAGVFRLPVFSA